MTSICEAVLAASAAFSNSRFARIRSSARFSLILDTRNFGSRSPDPALLKPLVRLAAEGGGHLPLVPSELDYLLVDKARLSRQGKQLPVPLDQNLDLVSVHPDEAANPGAGFR